VTYRWLDHTSEVELEIVAGSEREVFEEAVRALAELLGTEVGSVAGATVREVAAGATVREVAAGAADRPALLASWLEELVFLAESEGFVATQVLELDVGAERVRATVAGAIDEPPPLVKAVTYHRLAFAPSGGGYVARVVLDV
jgi:SHS2 domain-containing protein